MAPAVAAEGHDETQSPQKRRCEALASVVYSCPFFLVAEAVMRAESGHSARLAWLVVGLAGMLAGQLQGCRSTESSAGGSPDTAAGAVPNSGGQTGGTTGSGAVSASMRSGRVA